jgi:hypothetical protein
MRRMFGLLAGLVAAGDIAVATALEGNPLGIPAVTPAAETPMIAYGVILMGIALAAIVTSFAADDDDEQHGDDHGDRAHRPSADTASVEPGHHLAQTLRHHLRHADDERKVVHALRHVGWYVADDVVLPHVDVDHVAIGPAGVLAIQTQWTDRTDARGKPAARARIAAHQLRKALAVQELDVEVVPAVLTFGPGLTHEPGGVKVVDAVAMLNGYQAEEWLTQLTSRVLLGDAVVDAVRTIVGDLREGVPATAKALELVH